MMRYVMLTTLALASALSGPPAAMAQEAPSDSTSGLSDRTLAIDLWISDPVRIELSADQEATFDSLRARYAAEARNVRQIAEDGEDSQMGIVRRMLELKREYGREVRKILTPDQRPAFEKNFRASRFGGDGDERGGG